MIRLFGSNQALVMFFLPLVVGLFFIVNASSVGINMENEYPFGLWRGFEISRWLGETWLQTFAFIGLLINAVSLNIVYNTHEFQDRNTYLLALIYIIFMGFFDSFYVFDGIFACHFFMILALNQFFKLKQSSKDSRILFNGAFFVGIACTFFPTLAFALPIFLFIPLIFRPFNWREFLLFLLGFSLPFVYAFTLSIVSGFNVFNYFIINPVSIHFSSQNTIECATILALLTIAFLGVREKLRAASNRQKKQLQAAWLVFFIGSIAAAINLLLSRHELRLELVVVPLAMLFSYPLLSSKLRTASALIFYMLMAYNVLKFFIS